MVSRHLLTNARIVTPHRVVDGGTVVVEGGLIVDVVERTYPRARDVLDLGGRYVLPGLIDLHNDELEREINPRPGANLDPAFALAHFDRKLAAAGITTQFHAVSFANRLAFGRSVKYASSVSLAVHRFSRTHRALIDHHVLHRLDLRTPGALSGVLDTLETAPVAFVSLDEHVPGQGQLRDPLAYRRQIRPYVENPNATEAALDEEIARRLQGATESEVIAERTLGWLAVEGKGRGIVLASHDDDSPERVDLMHKVGCRISEFPVTVEAAERATALGMGVSVGAPNALRGASLSGNVSALALLERGAANMLVGDYLASALLAAIFRVADAGIADLASATRLASANPAAALGLVDRGTIEIGRRADLLIVECHESLPLVDATIIAGETRYAAHRFGDVPTMTDLVVG